MGDRTRLKEECPGSVEENRHFLLRFENSKYKMCDNGRCYFVHIDEKGVGIWQQGFDPLGINVNFIKNAKDDYIAIPEI
jgi:hypothetical protein